MSSFQYFKEKGYSQRHFRQQVQQSSTTIVIAAPLSSMRLAVTNLVINCNVGGSIAFYFNDNSLGNEYKLAEFCLAGSSTIIPVIQCWESTAVDQILVAKMGAVTNAGSENWKIEADAFDLE